jgi:hypothetical protein
MIPIESIDDKKSYNAYVNAQYKKHVKESGNEYVAFTPFTHKAGGSVEILGPDCYYQVTINKPMEFDAKSLLKDFKNEGLLEGELSCAVELMKTCLDAKFKGIYYDKSKFTYHIAVKFNNAEARYCIWKIKMMKVVPEAKGNKTVFEQCLQDAAQRARKKIRVNKYYDPDGVKPPGGYLFKISSNKVFKAMDAGAITMEEATSDEFFEKGTKVLVQPKLDGTRGIAFKVGKRKISFKSKEGRDCDVGGVFDKEIVGLINILNEKYPDKDIFIDGEVYAHGYSRADITRFMTVAKNKQERHEDLKYHVFTFSFEEFETKAIKRYKILRDIFDEYEFETLELVEATVVKDADTIKREFYRLTKLTKDLFEHNVKILKGEIDSKEIAEVQGGYEGIMIYHNEKYVHGERRNGLRKLKYYQEEKFELHDIIKEDRKGVKGRNDDAPKAMAVITYLGRTINIILTRTNAEKEEIYANRKKYLKKYKYAKIKFCAVTTDVNGDVNITGNSFVSFEE